MDRKSSWNNTAACCHPQFAPFWLYLLSAVTQEPVCFPVIVPLVSSVATEDMRTHPSPQYLLNWLRPSTLNTYHHQQPPAATTCWECELADGLLLAAPLSPPKQIHHKDPDTAFSHSRRSTHTFTPHVAPHILHSYILSSTEQWLWQTPPLGSVHAIRLFRRVNATFSSSALAHSKLMTWSLNTSRSPSPQLLHLYTSRGC